MAPFRVIMLPGSVLPAELAYGPLVAALGSDSEVVMKDLEVYASEVPPAGYTLDVATGVLREADGAGGSSSIWSDIPVVARPRW